MLGGYSEFPNNHILIKLSIFKYILICSLIFDSLV